MSTLLGHILSKDLWLSLFYYFLCFFVSFLFLLLIFFFFFFGDEYLLLQTNTLSYFCDPQIAIDYLFTLYFDCIAKMMDRNDCPPPPPKKKRTEKVEEGKDWWCFKHRQMSKSSLISKSWRKMRSLYLTFWFWFILALFVVWMYWYGPQWPSFYDIFKYLRKSDVSCVRYCGVILIKR